MTDQPPRPVVHQDSAYVYHVDATGPMRVPVRIFSSDKLIPQLQGDQSLIQASNVAQLPGIVDVSLVMPDAHQGYGFSIGGVAAFDLETGIISPGGVGYDINCLPPDARVQLQHGSWMPIGDLERVWSSSKLRFFDVASREVKESGLRHFLKRQERGVLYRITTDTGESIRVTADHPILTTRGMVPASDIGPDDLVHVSPFRGVPYETPPTDILITQDDVRSVLVRAGIPDRGNAHTQILNHLRKRGLLPLRRDSPQLSFLLKLLGFIFGDGHITCTDGGLTVGFTGKREDLEDIRRDIIALGLTAPPVWERQKRSTITTHYGPLDIAGTETSMHARCTAFGALLIALGCPYGKKTHQAYRVPSWVMDAPPWHKRLYLAAYFGAELTTPKTLNKFNFYEPTLHMNKHETLERNGVEFLTDIRALLDEFGVRTSSITTVPQRSYYGKHGKTVGLRVQVHGNPQNLTQLYATVGFAYNAKRQHLGSLAVGYLAYKERIIAQRTAIRSDARSLWARSVPPEKIISMLETATSGGQFILHSLWSKRGAPRIGSNALSFETFCATRSIARSGILIAKVVDVSVEPYTGWVYDVTMDDENHNFIADSVVVSNCGVRLLATNLTKEDILPRMREILDALYVACPVGVGAQGRKLTFAELDAVCVGGAHWAVAQGIGVQEDLERCEANGCLPESDPACVPQRAKQRGLDQLGTVGAGNHFVEVQVVDRIIDARTASAFGITAPGQVCVMIHCGSRGFGHQVCTEFIKLIEDRHQDIVAALPDRELVYAPLGTPLAVWYWGAMNAAANFAFANRHILGDNVRRALCALFGPKTRVDTVYDVCHNIAKRETHQTAAGVREVLVHRKGATRAFPPGHADIPDAYRDVGQPVLIPGSMGTASYVLVGAPASMELSFGSTAHGAGRTMSRVRAKRDYPADVVQEQLARAGVTIKAASRNGISEEAPGAYKDVDEVIRVSDAAGIAKTVARLVPIGVIKG